METLPMDENTVILIDKMTRTAEHLLVHTAGREDVKRKKYEVKFRNQENELANSNLDVTLDENVTYSYEFLLKLYYNLHIISNVVHFNDLKEKICTAKESINAFVLNASENKQKQ